ncbi:UNVERIFIED_CONTAM: hypothetical protein FKN15_050897 [Acipenser sinensis]
MASPGDRFEFAIDRASTFTDVFVRCPEGKVRVLKLLSEDPAEGIQRLLEEWRGERGEGLEEKVTQCYFDDGYLDTKVYLLEELSCDHSIPGPAIIIDKNRADQLDPAVDDCINKHQGVAECLRCTVRTGGGLVSNAAHIPVHLGAMQQTVQY